MPADRTIRSLFFVAVFLAVGTVIEVLYRLLTRDLSRRITSTAATTSMTKLSRLAIRFGISGLAIAMFAVGSVGTFLLFDWSPIVNLLIISLLSAFVIVRLINALSIFLLAPAVPSLRLVPLDTEAARYVHHWLLALAVVITFGVLLGGALESLGFFPQSRELIAAVLGLLVAIMAATAIWLRQERLAARLRSPTQDDGGSRMGAGFARLLPSFATLYLLTVWALWVIGATSLMWTLVILVALPLVDTLGKWFIRFAFSASGYQPEQEVGNASAAIAADSAEALSPNSSADEAVGQHSESPFVTVVHRTFRVFLVIGAMLGLASAWGIQWMSFADPTSSAAVVLRAAFNIAVALLLADLGWQLIRTAIDRRLDEIAAKEGPSSSHGEGEGGGGAGPHARLKTLLPIVRKFIQAVLAVMVTLIILSSLGVDIGPLLAGAGVVGLAIGFGAQALVRDIVAGIFFLIDDAFRVGEYIEIGELRGTVEGISVRSLRLRHHRGALHTIPFGEMTSVTNYSRDWVIMKLEFRIPFDTDLAKVKKIVKQIGKDLLADPTIGSGFLEPLKSQGVRRWEEFNMVLGVKFMAKPGEQFLIRREVYQRLRDAFTEAGITFASRDVQVKVARDATPEDIETAVQGAAMAALEPSAESNARKSA